MEEQSYLKNHEPVRSLREVLRHFLNASVSIKSYSVLFQDMVTSEEKKNNSCPTDSDKETIRKNIKVIEEMKGRLFDCFDLSSLTVKEIKLFAEVFLGEYFDSIRSSFPALRDSLPLEEVKYLSCVVTSDYLEGWLETSTSCKMTVSAFYDCCNTYYLPDEYNRNCTAPPYDKTQIYAAKRNFLNFVGLRQKQENDNMEMETKFFGTEDKAKFFNFIGLEWMISEHQLVLYRRPITKHYLNRKSKRNKFQNKMLYSDYTAFYEYLKVLDDCYDNREKDSLKARKFVVGSMLIRKLEQATRAQLSNVFAQAQIHHRDNKNLFGETLSNVYWGRYEFSGEESLLFPNGCSQKSITLVNEPYDVLSYKNQVDNLFNVDDSKQEQEISKWTALRAAQMDAQLFLRKMFPLDKVHSWNSDTFIDAGEFYNNDYPIVRTFLKDGDRMANSKGSEDFERFYDCIHKVYCTLYNTEATPLCELAKSSYFSSKKQVKRSD